MMRIVVYVGFVLRAHHVESCSPAYTESQCWTFNCQVIIFWMGTRRSMFYLSWSWFCYTRFVCGVRMSSRGCCADSRQVPPVMTSSSYTWIAKGTHCILHCPPHFLFQLINTVAVLGIWLEPCCTPTGCHHLQLAWHAMWLTKQMMLRACKCIYISCRQSIFCTGDCPVCIFLHVSTYVWCWVPCILSILVSILYYGVSHPGRHSYISITMYQRNAVLHWLCDRR